MTSSLKTQTIPLKNSVVLPHPSSESLEMVSIGLVKAQLLAEGGRNKACSRLILCATGDATRHLLVFHTEGRQE